jgi:hypothetical protein
VHIWKCSSATFAQICLENLKLVKIAEKTFANHALAIL